ncbi:MAG: 4Fe-4S binding protein [Butyricicoccus sp.]|nr:4Fe-4S binding protein [Butyricicoccus sp.]
MKYVLAFDPDKCSACSACVIACMDQNDIDVQAGEVAYRKTFDTEFKTEDGYYCAYISSACMHCADAPCIKACPVGCIKKDPDTGFTVYDNTNCIGCKSCALACPFGAPRFRKSDGKMVKCDGCYMRVKNGMQPACVRACSFSALQCLTEDEFESQEGLRALHRIAKSVDV